MTLVNTGDKLPLPHCDDLEAIVDELRVKLATTTDWAFGALFVGHKNANAFGLLFAADMPQHIRMSLISDLQECIDKMKKATRQ